MTQDETETRIMAFHKSRPTENAASFFEQMKTGGLSDRVDDVSVVGCGEVLFYLWSEDMDRLATIRVDAAQVKISLWNYANGGSATQPTNVFYYPLNDGQGATCSVKKFLDGHA